jgi:hypothetical protein
MFPVGKVQEIIDRKELPSYKNLVYKPWNKVEIKLPDDTFNLFDQRFKRMPPSPIKYEETKFFKWIPCKRLHFIIARIIQYPEKPVNNKLIICGDIDGINLLIEFMHILVDKPYNRHSIWTFRKVNSDNLPKKKYLWLIDSMNTYDGPGYKIRMRKLTDLEPLKSEFMKAAFDYYNSLALRSKNLRTAL